jgi:hypothetical protein
MMALRKIPMIRNPAMLKSFEHSMARHDRPDFQRNLYIVDCLYIEARTLGAFPLKDPLDGIEVDVHLAGVLNVRKPARPGGRGIK